MGVFYSKLPKKTSKVDAIDEKTEEKRRYRNKELYLHEHLERMEKAKKIEKSRLDEALRKHLENRRSLVYAGSVFHLENLLLKKDREEMLAKQGKLNEESRAKGLDCSLSGEFDEVLQAENEKQNKEAISVAVENLHNKETQENLEDAANRVTKSWKRLKNVYLKESSEIALQHDKRQQAIEKHFTQLGDSGRHKIITPYSLLDKEQLKEELEMKWQRRFDHPSALEESWDLLGPGNKF